MPGPVSESPQSRGRTIGGAVGLVVLALAAYLPALSAGYVWDDSALLTANPNVRTWEGLGRTWIDPRANTDYYPLTHTTFWIEYHLWGYAPLGYHLNNVLLHAVNALLVWQILRRLAVPGAWVAAAVFVVHPVQVEAVAWVSERKSVLGGLFCLLAVWLFVRAELAGEDLTSTRRKLLYGLSLAGFALALAARPVMMAVVAVLPLLVWYRHGRLTRREVFRMAWYWAMAAVVAPLTIWVQYSHVGATGESFDYSIPERLLIAGRALWFYAGKLVWPDNLMFCYDKWAIDAGTWWQWLFPAGAVAAVAALWILRRALGRGPLVGAMVFALMLSPALGFLNIYWHRYYFVADHMQYLACAGLIAVAVAAAARLGARARPVAWSASVAVLGVLGVLAWLQCGAYKDEEALWNDVLRKNPDSRMAHNNLGGLLASQGRVPEAIEQYSAAMRARPDDAEAHANRGAAYAAMGQFDQAIQDLNRAIELKPDYAMAFVDRGMVHGARRQYDQAIQDYNRAILIMPDYAEAYSNRGLVYSAIGHYDQAIQDYNRAIQILPHYAEAYCNRSAAYGAIREYDRVIEDADRAIQLNPAYARAYVNRGCARFEKGEFDRAILDYSKAIELKPDLAEAYYNRANAYVSREEIDRAMQDYDRAIQLEPGYANAYNNRGVSYFYQGDYGKAWDDLKKASQLGVAPSPQIVEALEKATGRKW